MCKKNKSNKVSPSKINLEKIIYGIALGIVGLFLTTNGLFNNNFDETNSKIDITKNVLVNQTEKIEDLLSKTGGSVGDINDKIERSFQYLNENFDAITKNFNLIQKVMYENLKSSEVLDNKLSTIRDFPPIPQKKPIILEDNISNAQLLDLLKIPVIGHDDKETDQNLRARIEDGVLDVSGKDGGFVFFRGTDASYYRVEGFFSLKKHSENHDPMGFSLIVHGGLSYKGAPLGASGIGVNYDRYAKKILIKKYPNDETIGEAFTFHKDFDVYATHHLRVDVMPFGEFVFYLDGAKLSTFHDYCFPSGMVGIRIWGNSRVKVSDLEIKKILPTEYNSGRKRLHLVSIGIGQFKDERIPGIYEAIRDAEDIIEIGSKIKHDRDLIPLLFKNADARRENVSYALSVLPQNGKENDILFVYFAGHGVELGNGKYYFLTSDTNVSSVAEVQSKGIEMKTIPDHIRAHKHGLKFLVIDTCHSEGAITSGFPLVEAFERRSLNGIEIQGILYDLLQRSGNLIVLAATHKKGKSKGIFTRMLLSGLEGAADGWSNNVKDNIITIGEIVDYTMDRVKEYAEDDSETPIVSPNFKNFRDKALAYVNQGKQDPENIFSYRTTSQTIQ